MKSTKIVQVFILCLSLLFFASIKTGKNRIAPQSVFKIMTYNIHHGEGLDGIIDINRIAGVIKDSNADIVLLQEVDVGMERSGTIDIPGQLSNLTGLNYYVFEKNLEIDGGEYGNATLSKYPIIGYKNIQFKKLGNEQRGILVTEIDINQSTFLILNTHLDNGSDDTERRLYVEKAVKEILPKYKADAVLFGGDFNDIPGSKTYKKVKEFFKDAWKVSGKNEGFTFPSNKPSIRIDFLFFKGNINSTKIEVLETEASDHRPVVAEFIRTNN